jgi:hypothetical protein
MLGSLVYISYIPAHVRIGYYLYYILKEKRPAMVSAPITSRVVLLRYVKLL